MPITPLALVGLLQVRPDDRSDYLLGILPSAADLPPATASAVGAVMTVEGIDERHRQAAQAGREAVRATKEVLATPDGEVTMADLKTRFPRLAAAAEVAAPDLVDSINSAKEEAQRIAEEGLVAVAQAVKNKKPFTEAEFQEFPFLFAALSRRPDLKAQVIEGVQTSPLDGGSGGGDSPGGGGGKRTGVTRRA